MPGRLSTIWQRYWGVALILASLVVGSFYYAQVREREAQEKCQAQYNAAFTKILDIRSEASARRQDAVDDVIRGVGELIAAPPAATEAERRAADRKFRSIFQRYTVAISEADAAREANPLPEVPSC